MEPIQIAEDIAVPRRDSDLTAWVSRSSHTRTLCPCTGETFERCRGSWQGMAHRGCEGPYNWHMSVQVNVIHGCNEKCTYCVVPNTRGIEQSRAPEAIRVSTCNALQAMSGKGECLEASTIRLNPSLEGRSCKSL